MKASTLTAPLKAQLLALAGLYVGNLRDAHAAVRMREVAAHLDDTWFAWPAAPATTRCSTTVSTAR